VAVSQIGWPLVTAAVTSAGRKLLLVPTANGPGDRGWLFGYSWAAMWEASTELLNA